MLILGKYILACGNTFRASNSSTWRSLVVLAPLSARITCSGVVKGVFSEAASINVTGALISNKDFQFIWYLASIHQKLHTFQFMNCSLLSNDINVKQHLSDLKMLQVSSHLKYSTIVHILHHCKSIEYLDLDSAIFTPEEIISLISVIPLLKTLSAPDCILETASIDELVTAFKNLSFLYIEDNGLSPQHAAILMHKVRNLVVRV